MLDAGNFSTDKRRFKTEELSVRQRKASLMLEGLMVSPVKPSAIGLGERDLLMGLDWLKSEETRWSVPFVLSNLECDDTTFQSVRLVQLGSQTMAVYSMISPSILEGQDSGSLRAASEVLNGCRIVQPSDWLREHQVDADIHVVFADLNDNEMDALTPWADLLVETKIGKMNHHPKAIDATTVWVGPGSKGKNMLELSWTWNPTIDGFSDPEATKALEVDLDRKQKRLLYLQEELAGVDVDSAPQKRLQRQIDFANQGIAKIESQISLNASNDASANPLSQKLLPLNRSYEDWVELTPIIERAQKDIETLEQSKDIEAYHGDFVGSKFCQSCHSAIYEQWSKTAHATAWDTLVEKGRALDGACFSCHSTGGGLETGPSHPTQITEALQGVGCESCHGSGQTHIQQPSASNIQRTVPDSTCVTCHNGVQDNGEFEPIEYRKRIVHHE